MQPYTALFNIFSWTCQWINLALQQILLVRSYQHDIIVNYYTYSQIQRKKKPFFRQLQGQFIITSTELVIYFWGFDTCYAKNMQTFQLTHNILWVIPICDNFPAYVYPIITSIVDYIRPPPLLHASIGLKWGGGLFKCHVGARSLYILW